MKIIKKIIRNILSKFNLPKMDISDKEYEKSLKEYVDKVGSEKGEPLIVPNENFKRIIKSQKIKEKIQQIEKIEQEIFKLRNS